MTISSRCFLAMEECGIVDSICRIKVVYYQGYENKMFGKLVKSCQQRHQGGH